MTHEQPHAAHAHGGHEQPGVSVRGVILAGAGLAALIAATLFGLSAWVRSLSRGATAAADTLSPVDVGPQQVPLDPQQRLQRERYDAEQESLLTTYGWIDQEKKIVRIPIEEAMRRIVSGEGQR